MRFNWLALVLVLVAAVAIYMGVRGTYKNFGAALKNAAAGGGTGTNANEAPDPNRPADTGLVGQHAAG